MTSKTVKRFMCDYETTVYDGQEDTQVWAVAMVEIGDPKDDVKLFTSIWDWWNHVRSIQGSIYIYFHNLKFDGTFILSYLLHEQGYGQAYGINKDGGYHWYKTAEMQNNTLKYSISDRGVWYTITVRVDGRTIEIRDSLKLLPLSVDKIGKSFCKERRKLDLEYRGYRFPGCPIPKKEQPYIKNDVLIPKEALEEMFEEGHDKLTIGACCMSEYKKIFGIKEFKQTFPDLSKMEAAPWTLFKSADEYIRKAYSGGWTYLKSGCENIIYEHGCTADVNSLYPSVMHSDSGNEYPYGSPIWWKGAIPEEALKDHRFYYVRVRMKFKIKPGHLPFIQIKNNLLYPVHTHLSTSAFYDRKSGAYFDYYEFNGKLEEVKPTLTFSKPEWELIQEHYHIIDLEVLDGCWFHARAGMFDDYINHWSKIKQTSTGGRREIAKLYLNNLYGKFGANTNSSYKMVYFDEAGAIHYKVIEEYEKTPGYVAVGAAVTAYARRFTITAAQKNYKHFIYADTDSIHCDCRPDQLVGVPIHETKFNHWKIEMEWERGLFVRQKTYIETAGDDWVVKCAGMPDTCKELFLATLEETDTEIREEQGFQFLYRSGKKVAKIKDEYQEFLSVKRTLSDFKVGLTVPGLLKNTQIPGGTLLKEGIYTMK